MYNLLDVIRPIFYTHWFANNDQGQVDQQQQRLWYLCLINVVQFNLNKHNRTWQNDHSKFQLPETSSYSLYLYLLHWKNDRMIQIILITSHTENIQVYRFYKLKRFLSRASNSTTISELILNDSCNIQVWYESQFFSLNKGNHNQTYISFFVLSMQYEIWFQIN